MIQRSTNIDRVVGGEGDADKETHATGQHPTWTGQTLRLNAKSSEMLNGTSREPTETLRFVTPSGYWRTDSKTKTNPTS